MAPKNHRTNTASSTSSSSILPSAKTLQDRLHELLSLLSYTIEHVKNWPPDNNNEASIQSERTKLIQYIRDIVSAIQRVENCIKNDLSLKQTLQNCLIPLDLLDLLDVSELNPDCFSRGLLKEATSQLGGLQRRKYALEMLGSAIQKGLNEKDNNKSNNKKNQNQQQQQQQNNNKRKNNSTNTTIIKQEEVDNNNMNTVINREQQETTEQKGLSETMVSVDNNNNNNNSEPATKKQKIG